MNRQFEQKNHLSSFKRALSKVSETVYEITID